MVPDASDGGASAAGLVPGGVAAANRLADWRPTEHIASETLLKPGRSCWRIETARRAACLVDGEAYFAAAKQALLRARHSVLLIGWNFAEHASLEPGGTDLEWPDRVGDLLQALVERREGLRAHVLVWDKAATMALGRRRVPGVQAARMNTGCLQYRLDAQHPVLAAHHQKILVIDDAVAFCGGFDFAANRWDTRGHDPQDPRRKLPTGAPYEAHHDVMMIVDGLAARALAELARERWLLATGERLDPPPAGLEAWPEGVTPDFRDVPVGIVRTAPAWQGRPEVREVERLYLDSIAAARETIYVESQYLASPEIGRALAARLGEPQGPEVVIVNPKRAPNWIEQVAMDNARTQIARRLCDADRYDRFRLFAAVNQGKEIVVHSKVMIVDDRLLRIGSSNLNNRSMGVDTECDLAIEAPAGSADEKQVRAAIVKVRNDLISEHLGMDEAQFSRALEKHGSVIRAIDALNGASERRLASFPPPRAGKLNRIEHNALMDPFKPIGAERPLLPRRGFGLTRGSLCALAALAALSGILVFKGSRR